MGAVLTILSVVGLAFVIFTTQFTKWEDRRDGKRWWEDTRF